MRIERLEISEKAGQVRLSARVSYETAQRPAHEIFFEVDREHRVYLRPIYEPFLLACFPAALFHGEERIAIDGELCPEVESNVRSAMLLQKRWWGGGALPLIEHRGNRVLTASSPETACFMSGGVDSLSSYCRNLSVYPAGDPRRISHAIFVYGMDVGDPNKVERKDVFTLAKEKLATFLAASGCLLIPVYTNARDVEPDWQFYEQRHFGPLLGGIAHAMSGKFGRCRLALDSRVDFFDEWASHPWLNKYFSSSAVTVESSMDAFSRLEKYSLLGQYPESLSVLRVCYMMNEIPEGQINCGKCPKCIRTKIELLASGLLERAETFSDKTIGRKTLRGMAVNHAHDLEYVGEPIDRLREIGENEIADYLASRIKKYQEGPSLRDRLVAGVKYADRKLLNGAIKSTYERLAP